VPENVAYVSEVAYAELLARRYGEQGLVTVVIARPGSPWLQRVEGISKVVVVVDDDSLSLHRLFHVRSCCGGSIVLDGEGMVRFAVPYLARADIIGPVVEAQISRCKVNGLSR
jgi:hypothetical protein